MECYVIGYDGVRYSLPTILGWKLEYGTGVPCDAFWVKCVWEPGDEKVLSPAIRFIAEENGETVFTGVVDEFECGWSESGGTLTISGRSMAALLLDNEAEACEYQTATWSDIVRDHVTPYGITTVSYGLPAVSGFAIASGSSEWEVVYDYACYYCGVSPRFDRLGRLVAEEDTDELRFVLNDSTPVTEVCYREKRYGVLSEVIIKNQNGGIATTVTNAEFKHQGGCCRRVLNMPAKSTFQSMRYNGQYQLKQSEKEYIRLEAEIPIAFFAFPGNFIIVERTGWGCNGKYRVIETVCEMNSEGHYTKLVLGTSV